MAEIRPKYSERKNICLTGTSFLPKPVPGFFSILSLLRKKATTKVSPFGKGGLTLNRYWYRVKGDFIEKK